MARPHGRGEVSGEPHRTAATRVARSGFAAVVLAAGVSGVALLVAPSSTGGFFSWRLGPPPLASLIGGLYVASSFVFGTALVLPWRQVRSLVAAAFVLTAPTFVATMVHLEVFDLGRWQAWFWILLFGSAPWFWAGLLVTNRTASTADESGRRGWALVVLAVALAAGAVAVWIYPVAASKPLPVDFSPMGGRFAGSWLAFLAVMAAWAGLRPAEARLPLVAMASCFGGALLAGLRSFSDLGPQSVRIAYVAVIALGGVVFAAAALRTSASVTGARGS